MSQPSVNVTELDGALGVLPPSAGKIHVVVGVSSDGTENTPATYARVSLLEEDFGRGPMVEAAARHIEKHGAVAVIKTGQSVAGSYLDEVEAVDGDVVGFDDSNVAGACTITVVDETDALIDASVQVIFPIGGTVGVSGIVYQVSVDGGATFGLATALGVSTTIAVGHGTGISLNLTAATIIAGDYVTFTTVAPIEASAGEVVHSGLQNAPTIGAPEPDDDYEVKILFVAGGTRGTPGVTYKWSLDNGRNYSPVTALGSAVKITLSEAGGVEINLGVGTIAAGATIAFPTVAPKWSDEELSDALEALRASAISWEIAHIVGPIDADSFDVVDGAFSSMAAAGKHRAWVGNTRTPVGDESESAYLSTLTTEFESKAGVYGELCAGAARITSSVSGRKYTRPVAFAIASRESSVSQEIDIAAVNLGPLSGVSIRDENGNVVCHDESVNPGLDDARFSVLRTWDEVQGVYPNNPRIFSATGSDFEFMQHRRVLNVAHDAVRSYLVRRLNEPVQVDPKTGFITDAEAREIEVGATGAMRAALLAKPKASAVSFVLSRTDNILSTKTLTGEARVTPLGYPKTIEISVGYQNPALQVG